MGAFWEYTLNGLVLGSIYALVALGYSLAFSVLRFINFAHSEVYMFSALLAYSLWRLVSDWPVILQWGVVWGGTLLAGSFLGWGIEALAYRPLRSAPRINVLITAIGVSLALQNAAILIFGADPKFFQLPMPNVQLGFIQWSDGLIWFCLGVSVIGLRWLIFHTYWGRALRAVSYSTELASSVGIPVNRVVSVAFILSGFFAALSALLIPLKYPKVDASMGLLMGVKAFVAAVLGGLGRLEGAILGGLLLGLLEQWVSGFISSHLRDAVAFMVLWGILMVKPEGLWGVKTTEKV